jgi:hypothetical protein
MPKPNKTLYIDFILNELNNGNVQYKDVCLVFLSKFKCTEPTFVSYWKKANETYQEQRIAINNAKLNDSITQEKEAQKTLILNKIERMKIAEEIAIGKAKRVEGTIVMPSPSDRLKALDYLSKIEGDYSAQKISLTQPKVLSNDPLNANDNSTSED